jgi:hypothetical protein
VSPPQPPGWPGSRLLLTWWRDLAPWRPRALRLAHLVVHQVGALARVARPAPLDPLARALLARLSSSASAEEPSLDADIRARLLGQLRGVGLIEAGPGGGWQPTAPGRTAATAGLTVHAEERLVFPFVEFASDRPPHYLRLSVPEGHALEAAPFDPALLRACVERSPEWKATFGFPAEVEAVLTGGGPDWRRVVVSQAQQQTLAFVETADAGGEVLLGFAVRTEGWLLEREAPVLTLHGGLDEVFPGLRDEPPPEAWRQAWEGWCQQRSLPPSETSSAHLERVEYRLRVSVPGRLVERLRTARSDALKGEAWLLAGSGRQRTAAQIEISESAAEEAGGPPGGTGG